MNSTTFGKFIFITIVAWLIWAKARVKLVSGINPSLKAGVMKGTPL